MELTGLYNSDSSVAHIRRYRKRIMHPWWIRIPGLIIGIIIFAGILLYGIAIITGMHNENKKLNWIGYLCIGIGSLGSTAWLAAWDEQRVIAAFAEWFVADALLYAIPIGGITAGYFAGNKAFKKTEKKWLGWTVGIIVAFLIMLPLYKICAE